MGTPLGDIALPKSDDLIGLSSDKYSCAFNDPKSLNSTWIMNINEREVRAAERVCCVWLWASKPRWRMCARATSQSLHRRPPKNPAGQRSLLEDGHRVSVVVKPRYISLCLQEAFRPLQTGCGLFVQINDTHKKKTTRQSADWVPLFPHRMWISRCEKGILVFFKSIFSNFRTANNNNIQSWRLGEKKNLLTVLSKLYLWFVFPCFCHK